MDSFFSKTLGKSPDWFWDWVERSFKDPGGLMDWFEECKEQELIDFYKKYWDEVMGGLIPVHEGIYLAKKKSNLSEDDQQDFNSWIIIQGQALWQAAAVEAEKRNLEGGKAGGDAIWETLFEIYSKAREARRERKELGPQTWSGVTWKPRNGYFPGGEAELVYEERFGVLISEKLSA